MRKATRWLPLLALIAGCDLPGKPDPASKFVAPTKNLDFMTLYGKNCAGCHGKDGNLGPAPPLNDAAFLAIAPETELIKVIAGGRSGTEMPAFALNQGGTLTDEQVKVLARGLPKQWGNDKAKKIAWPEYLLPAEKGDADHGAAAFARDCATCHGHDGKIDPKIGAINDPAFLALASEQMLRRIVITGRADLGMPNYAEHKSGELTSAEINNLVALLMSWKQNGAAKKE